MDNTGLDAFAYSLARIDWDVFGTLTFRSVPSLKVSYGRAWSFFGLVSKAVQRPYSGLLIALREERGEIGGRFHFHFLLGGTGSRNRVTLSHQCEKLWAKVHGQGAIARCRQYDAALRGVPYVTKCLSGGGLSLGANRYEVRKFDSADTLTLSRSVLRVIRSHDRMGLDGSRGTCEKMAAAEIGGGSAG